MPAVTNYVLIVDLFRFNVIPSPILPLEGSPVVDLIHLTQSTAKPEYKASGFTLTKVNSHDAAYHLKYEVRVGTQLLGFILTHRTKNYGYNKHLRSFHVDNSAFYTLNWTYFLPQFLRVFGLAVGNISQLDISLNTQQYDLAEYLHKANSKPAQYQFVKGKKESGLTGFESTHPDTGKPVRTKYWNRNSNTVSLVAYNKTDKLRSEPKPYQTDFFAASGFTPKKDVYRLEMSVLADALKEYRRYAVTEDGEEISVYRAANNNVHSKASKQTETTEYNIDIEKLNSQSYLAQLYQHFFPIDLRKKDATRLTNCTQIPLVNWSIYQRQDTQETLTVTVATRPTTNTLNMEKNALKYHVGAYADTGATLHLDMARSIAARHQLTDQLVKLLAKLPTAEPTPNNTPALAA